jgi:hypothetical protein
MAIDMYHVGVVGHHQWGSSAVTCLRMSARIASALDVMFGLAAMLRNSTLDTTRARVAAMLRNSTLDTTRARVAATSSATCFSVEHLVAVRGERLVAWIIEASYESAPSVRAVIVTQFDSAVLRVERQVHFDLEDVDAALAELDSMYAALDEGEQTTPDS